MSLSQRFTIRSTALPLRTVAGASEQVPITVRTGSSRLLATRGSGVGQPGPYFGLLRFREYPPRGISGEHTGHPVSAMSPRSNPRRRSGGTQPARHRGPSDIPSPCAHTGYRKSRHHRSLSAPDATRPQACPTRRAGPSGPDGVPVRSRSAAEPGVEPRPAPRIRREPAKWPRHAIL